MKPCILACWMICGTISFRHFQGADAHRDSRTDYSFAFLGNAMEDVSASISSECGTLENSKKIPNQVGAGKTLNGYILQECVGAGAFAEVWAVRKPGEASTYVMKILHSASALMMGPTLKPECDLAKDAKKRVRRANRGWEIADCVAEGKITYQGIDPWTDPPEPEDFFIVYMVNEQMAGSELERILKTHMDDAPPTIPDMKRALEIVHKLWVVMDDLSQSVDHIRLFHDDMQPSNVMLSSDGHVGLIDYGQTTRCWDGSPEDYLKEEMEMSRRGVKKDCTVSTAWQVVNRHSEDHDMAQSRFLAQSFLSMLIKFPDRTGYDGGLTAWFVSLKQDKKSPQAIYDEVKASMKLAYKQEWTPACDHALKVASHTWNPDSPFPATELLNAIKAANASLK